MSDIEFVPQDPFRLPDPEDPATPPSEVRAAMAFNLRRAGASYKDIAEKLGYNSAAGAERVVRQVIEEHYTPKAVEDVLKLEMLRLDDLLMVAYRRLYDGDLKAIDRILKIMERRSKYLGLDMPETVSTTEVNNTAIFVGGDQKEYVERLREARELAQQR